MIDDDLKGIIGKLRYQVSVLGQTIDYDRYPVESLILSMDWGPGEIDKAHDIFERWEARINAGNKINKYEFEQEFESTLGLTYQGLKSVVIAFWENSQWTSVIEAYVETFGNAPPVEYHRIARRER